jgi:energy-coupling factor transport system permease protein
MMYHPLTWLLWLVAAVVPALITRNPLYLLILLLTTAVVYMALGARSPLAASWGVFLRAGLLLWGITFVFDALTAHYGTTVLFSLPRSWPLIGGRITLEAVVFGMTSGLALITLLLIFAVFNALVDHYRLLRLMPSFLYQAGVVASIALTFVPSTARSLREIREAQMVRGHRFRGLRDLLPLFIPLVTSGLERAIQLAEAMESRGFSRAVALRQAQDTAPAPASSSFYRLALGGATLACCIGLFGYSYSPAGRWPSLALFFVGLSVLLAVLHRMGRATGRTRYRRDLWRRRDTLVSLSSGAVLMGFAGLLVMSPQALAYPIYPRVTWPSFEPLIGLALLPIIAPALAANRLYRN